MGDLKPCPFCGVPPMLHGRLGRFNVLHSCDAIKANIGTGKKDYVIAKWNTRADTDEVARLSKELGDLGSILEGISVSLPVSEFNTVKLLHSLIAKIRQPLNSKGTADSDTQEAASE